MSDRHLRTCLTALTCGLLLLATSCGDDDHGADLNATMGQAAEAPEPQLDPMAGAPTAGSCYKLKQEQAQASTSSKKPVTSCYDAHNTLTYHVGLFPEGTTTADPDVVRRQCQKRLTEATGLTRGKLLGSVIDWIWFEPTTTQWGAGARWFRCDLTAVSDGKLKLLPETSFTTDIFSEGLDDRYARCIRTGPDTNGDGKEDPVYLTCDKDHDFRWAGFFEPKQATSFPGNKKFTAYANDECADIAGTQSWWAVWPSEDQWNAGEHRMSCYKKTSA